MTGYIIGLFFGIFITLLSIHAIRQGNLVEKYAFIWTTVSVVLLLIFARPGIFGNLSKNYFGVDPIHFLLFMGITWTCLVLIVITSDLSKLIKQNRRLSEELAIHMAEKYNDR